MPKGGVVTLREKKNNVDDEIGNNDLSSLVLALTLDILLNFLNDHFSASFDLSIKLVLDEKYLLGFFQQLLCANFFASCLHFQESIYDSKCSMSSCAS